MSKPVVHWELMGKDGKRLQSYYGELFGWEYDTNNPRGYGLVNAVSHGIGGGVGEAPEAFVTFYVGVPDVSAALEQAQALGGTRVMGPESIQGEVPGTETVIGLLKDPEDNLVGVVEIPGS